MKPRIHRYKQFQTEKKVILYKATFNPEMGKLSTYWSIIKVSQRDYLKMNSTPCLLIHEKALLIIPFDHDDVIKWKHFPRYWPFVRGIHRSPVNSPHKGQWRGALMFSLICVWINGWVNNREAGDLKLYRAYYDVIVMDEDASVAGCD